MRISSKTFSVFAACMLLVGIAVGAAGGCGSSSGTDFVSICNQACNKEVTCLGAEAAALGFSASTCSTQCMQQGNTMSCPRAAALSSGAQACLAMNDCAAFETCMQGLGDCTTAGGSTGGTSGSTGGTTGTGGTSSATGGTTGTGGTSAPGGAGGHGTGGTAGGGGTSGTADCSACTTFVSSGCCASLATFENMPTSQCTSIATACAANPSQAVTSCQAGMTAGAALSLSGCK